MPSISPPSQAPDQASPSPKQSGYRLILANLGHLLAGKAGAGIISLVYLLIVTRSLGARDYGLLVLLNGVVVFVGSVVAFSGFHGVVRYGALALAKEDRRSFAAIARFMTVVEVGFGLLAVAVAMIAIPLLMPRFGWPAEMRGIALLYGLAVIATVRATPQGILQVAGRFDLIGLHQLVSPVVRLVGALAVWSLGGGLASFVTAWLAASIAEGIAMWLLALPAWRTLAHDERLLGAWREVPRGHPGFLSFIVTTNMDITVRELAPNLAPLTIGWILGPASAGLFALTQRASAVLAQPAQALGQASYAVLARQAAAGAFADLRQSVRKSVLTAFLVGLPIVALFALTGDRILMWLGGGSFKNGAMLLVLVGAARLSALAAAPLASGLTALGHPQRSMTIALATNFGLYPLLPVLLWWLGQDGAGWHALLQTMVALIALQLGFAASLRKANP